MEATLAKLKVVPVVPSLLELPIGSFVAEEASLYGHFSPRATSCPSSMFVLLTASGCVVIDDVLALVLSIMPERQERCGEPTSPLSLVLLKEMEHLGSVGDEVDEVGALAPNFEAQLLGSPLPSEQPEAPESVLSMVPMAEDDILFEIQLGSLLTRLEAVIPGSGKKIVEKALRWKSKDATTKASVAV